MTLFVDGYNVIFAASRRLPGFDVDRTVRGKTAQQGGSRTEAAREALLELLAKYRASHPGRIVVFFDGGPEAAHLPRLQMSRGMEVIFSEAHSDADSDLKAAVARESDPRSIRVITSDAAIRRSIERHGAAATDSAEFLTEVVEALKESSIPADEPIEKYEGCAGEDADYWMRIFGGEDPKNRDPE